MTGLVVVVPSRGRPEAAVSLAQAFARTCTAADTRLVFSVDTDDPSDYSPLIRNGFVDVAYGVNGSMVEALNRIASETAETWDAFAVGFMGDDHRPRTKGWDAAYLDALRELGTGIVYGNDLLQREKLPTQCALTADIVRALTHMAPPTLTHLYVDNYWRALGEQAGCIRYLPDVVVEHLHPVAGKAKWDEGYRRVNDRGMYTKDAAAFAAYTQSHLSGDVAKVQALRSARV